MVGLVSVALVAAAGVAWARTRDGCGSSVTSVSASDSSSPFLDARQMRKRPDENRDTLVKTLAADPAPIGKVVGAVGYHYEQWAHVSAFAQGIGVRTRDNPDFTMIDDKTLKPLWSIQVDTRRSAYDASDQRYLVAALTPSGPADLVALDADTGDRIWCSTLGTHVVTGVDPFATQILDDEDVTVLGPAAGNRVRLARLDHEDGAQEWSRTLEADGGDHLGELGSGTLLVGGSEQYKLFDPTVVSRRPAGTALALVSAEDGHTLWTRKSPAGADLHVIGTAGGTAVFQEWDSATKRMRLTAVDDAGRQRWSVTPGDGGYFDAVLRAGRALVRDGNRWSAYSLEDGHRLWTRALPEKPQFLPYGFELGDVPLLDDDHALIGGTTALHALDLDTGVMTDAALPTDGINTTYWPYQTAVSPGLIAVATNTGAAVVRRE
jgi:outer membrane protein assembly factor BamB